MPLHRVEVIYSVAGSASFNPWIQTWLNNMLTWEQAPNEPPGQTAGDPQTEERDGPYRGQLVFQWTQDRAHIEQPLWQYMTAYCEWAVQRYHVCSHGDDDVTSCPWDETTTNGPVPAEYDPTV